VYIFFDIFSFLYFTIFSLLSFVQFFRDTPENTYSLAEASGVYGQEVGLLAEIIEDYANRVLPVKISNEED